MPLTLVGLILGIAVLGFGVGKKKKAPKIIGLMLITSVIIFWGLILMESWRT